MIKRYDMDCRYYGDDFDLFMSEEKDGDYVKYEDMKTEIKKTIDLIQHAFFQDEEGPEYEVKSIIKAEGILKRLM